MATERAGVWSLKYAFFKISSAFLEVEFIGSILGFNLVKSGNELLPKLYKTTGSKRKYDSIKTNIGSAILINFFTFLELNYYLLVFNLFVFTT
jgi:hypothetical protein